MGMRSVFLPTIVTVVLRGCLMVALTDARPLIQASGLVPENPRCEYLVNPLGIGVTGPRLSWTVESNQRGQIQSAYRVLVASNPKLLGKDMGDLWDSGKVTSNRSSQIAYQGLPLKSQMRCYWKVRVWDKQGQPSAWSRRAYWTMGLLDPNDWKAKWIGKDEEKLHKNPASPFWLLEKAKWIWSGGEKAEFTKTFDVAKPPAVDPLGPVRRLAPGGGFPVLIPHLDFPRRALSRRERLAAVDNVDRFFRPNLAAVPKLAFVACDNDAVSRLFHPAGFRICTHQHPAQPRLRHIDAQRIHSVLALQALNPYGGK